MLQDNKKLLAVYAAWAFIHVYLWLTTEFSLFSPSGAQSSNFYPINAGDWYEPFDPKSYDYSELFIYMVAPLLIWYLYKTFKK